MTVDRAARAADLASALLVAAATLLVVVRITLVPGPFADPDRSRFLTVESLVLEGDYAVGSRVTSSDGAVSDLGPVSRGRTVDVVLDPETQQFYSSKPPLLPTLVAAEVLALQRAFSWRIDTHGSALVRAVLLTFHAAPFFAYLVLLAFWLSRTCSSPRVRLYVLALAGFATFVTPFTSALNNHALGAFSALFAVVPTLWIFEHRRGALLAWIVAGFAGGACFTQEMPALTLVGACTFLLFTVDRARTLLFFVPAALLPMLASLAANTVALGNPWFFFQVPTAWYHFEGAYWLRPSGLDVGERSVLVYAFHLVVGHHGLLSLTPAFWLAVVALIRRPLAGRGLRLARVGLVLLGAAVLVLLPAILNKRFGLPDELAILPILVLGAAPLLAPYGWWRSAATRGEASARLSAACILPTLTFYLVESDNYGGITSGPRWLLWLTPLLLLLLPEPVARLERSTLGRVCLVVLFAASAFSALSVGLNPYQHPWLYVWWTAG